MLLIALASGGCTMAMLGVGNAYHMTVERALTPKVEKRFRVLDAETHAPVPGATVTIVHDFDWQDDWEVRGRTGDDGVVTLKLAEDALHLVNGDAAANGYLGREHMYFVPQHRKPGNGLLSDDPIDIFLYRGPAPAIGLRVPAGFTGWVSYEYPLITYDGTNTHEIPFPPTFPAGQRVWWTTVTPGERKVIDVSPPRLGDPGVGDERVLWLGRGDAVLPIPEPGGRADGVTAWPVDSSRAEGTLLYVGTRTEALAEVKRRWERDGSAYNGWMRDLAPEAYNPKVSPYAGATVSAKRR